MTPNRPASTALLIAALLAAPRLAHADDALARQYFRQGVDLYDKRQYQPALESFQKAYAEKPSPGIKQNIALSLKGLGRPVEAATAFDEALDEGQGTLRPEVRAAMEQELGELSKIVATVRFRIITKGDHKPIEGVVVTVDGKELSAAALRRPVRLEPGIHVFKAHAERLADPPDKKLSILAGSPVDATFEIAEAAVGMLTIKPSVADALVQVDGADVPTGAWPRRLTAGKHKVSVSAPGYQTTTTEVTVSADAAAEYPITLLRPGDVPPPYEGPVLKPPPPYKKRYIVPMLSYAGQSLRLAPALQERIGGVRRNFTGVALGVRGGYRFSKNFAFELHGEVGQMTSSYTIGDKAVEESTTKVLQWQLTPGLRFATVGGIRFTAGVGVGLHGLSVTSHLHTTTDGKNQTNTDVKGNGVSASALADIGMQLDIGSLFVEAAGFVDVHGVGSARDDAKDERLFLSSPSTRAGIRAGLGIPF